MLLKLERNYVTMQLCVTKHIVPLALRAKRLIFNT
jgi:hypothetical protein